MNEENQVVLYNAASANDQEGWLNTLNCISM